MILLLSNNSVKNGNFHSFQNIEIVQFVSTTENITDSSAISQHIDHNYTIPKDATPDQFISVWNTSLQGITNSSQLLLPLIPTGVYNFTVDWGDGFIDTITSYYNISIIHNYNISGVYMLLITGQIEGFGRENPEDKPKLIDILQWGNLRLGNQGHYFQGAYNLQITASDSPDLSTTTDLSYSFVESGIGTTGNLAGWDTSHITDMSFMFYNCWQFNQSLAGWRTSAVVDMKWMFAFDPSDSKTYNGSIYLSGQFSHFDGSVGSWDVSSVIDMTGMFYNATSFDQPLNSWNTLAVRDMRLMFYNAGDFNQAIDQWNVSSVIQMTWMFGLATAFNQSLDTWNISAVTELYGMFFNATSFNQPLNSWDVSHVTDMSYMFMAATTFNQPLDQWDTSQVDTMQWMFGYAFGYNQSLANWNISSVSYMNHMLEGVSLPLAIYDSMLINWAIQSVTDNVVFSAGLSQYTTAGLEARQKLLDDYHWQISDGGLYLPHPSVESSIPRKSSTTEESLPIFPTLTWLILVYLMKQRKRGSIMKY